MLSLSRQGWCSKEYAGRTLLWAISAMAGRSATIRVGFDTASVKMACTAQMLQGLNSHRLLHRHSHTCLQGVVQVLWAVLEHALVLLVIAALMPDRSEMSTKVVWMLHFAGRNDLKRANVPPASQHSTCLYGVTHRRIMTCIAMCGTPQHGGHTAMSTATGWRHTIHCAGCHNVVPSIAQLEDRGGDCCHACGEAQPGILQLVRRKPYL